MKGMAIFLLLLVDAIGSVVATKLIYSFRFESEIFTNPLKAELLLLIAALTLFWWILFAFQGMYRTPLALSRFDEIVKCMKGVLIGVVILFIITFDVSQPITFSRFFLLSYGLIMFVVIGVGRTFVRNYQRRLRSKGIGLGNAIIVGFNEVGRQLHDQLYNYPVWGFNVVGFVDSEQTEAEHHGVRIIGDIDCLPQILQKNRIQWVLISPKEHVQDALLSVFDHCGSVKVRFLIVADYYHMVVGMMRTVQIHGLPLVEVVPQLVPTIVLALKRLTDIAVGAIMSLITIILFPFVAAVVKIGSKGSLFTIMEMTGKGGTDISLLRFRTTTVDPESGKEKESKSGRFLKRWQLNDLPMFFNVLKGDVSLVGPSPELTEIVKVRQDSVPLYNRRFMIRPGLTGWTQLREKTGYDLFYVDHISPLLDMKIIIATIWNIIRGKW